MSNLKYVTTIILFGLCITPSVKTKYCYNPLEDCPPNSKCLGVIGCRCVNGYVFVGAECQKVFYQKVLEPCNIQNGSVYVCDDKQHSFCAEKKCVCFATFLPNVTSGRCEPEADFLLASNLTKYIVLHGEYCNSKSHCVEGLECSKHECSCPSTCIYKKEIQACDCGATGPSTGPIIVGILGGLLIIAFWSWTIRITWKSAFLPNVTSGRCEPEADFLRASNFTKYIVPHGEYCYSKSHCIEGLECSKYACSCPR
ncbi:uncharacterized protein LOC134780241 isoform X3 [Penaeus indicus]|uniref:uncharacterized protein LOC134780241 isoform X3 n=1 Tax=Penaeus indicus TaxID=29960 RepID=UPI00300D07B4